MPSESSQTIVIQVVEPPQTNHNILHKIKQAAIVICTIVVAVVQKVEAVAQQVVVVVRKVVAVVQKVVAGVHGIVAPLRRAWLAFEEEQAANPPPLGIDFIVTCLIGFAAIKAQGDQGFPSHTHPELFKVSVISLLLYGFASAAERLMVSIRHRNPTHRAIALLGRSVSLGILIGSLASFFFI